MQGFEGPFRFDIEEVGSKMAWDTIDETLRNELTCDGRYTRSNSDVYMCRIAVVPDDLRKEKNHDWKKVNRIFVEARTGSTSILICGISPTGKKVKELNQTELALLKTLSGSVKLFNSLEFKLDIANPVGILSRRDRFAVMSFFTRHLAQWVFSDGWEQIGFELYLYVVVPTTAPEDKRYIEISVKPTWKKNKFLSQAAVWNRRINLPSAGA